MLNRVSIGGEYRRNIYGFDAKNGCSVMSIVALGGEWSVSGSIPWDRADAGDSVLSGR